jgi:creatinine amidohydrolase
MEKDYTHLRPAGQHGFGWIAQDINRDGAVGDASAATAEKGRLTAEHQADAFIALLRDVAAVSAKRARVGGMTAAPVPRPVPPSDRA